MESPQNNDMPKTSPENHHIGQVSEQHDFVNPVRISDGNGMAVQTSSPTEGFVSAKVSLDNWSVPMVLSEKAVLTLSVANRTGVKGDSRTSIQCQSEPGGDGDHLPSIASPPSTNDIHTSESMAQRWHDQQEEPGGLQSRQEPFVHKASLDNNVLSPRRKDSHSNLSSTSLDGQRHDREHNPDIHKTSVKSELLSPTPRRESRDSLSSTPPSGQIYYGQRGRSGVLHSSESGCHEPFKPTSPLSPGLGAPYLKQEKDAPVQRPLESLPPTKHPAPLQSLVPPESIGNVASAAARTLHQPQSVAVPEHSGKALTSSHDVLPKPDQAGMTLLPPNAVPTPAPTKFVAGGYWVQVTRGYPNILSEPPTSPIALAQLVNEVKGIYVGLAMVESKCIEIDNEQSQRMDPRTRLSDAQWQALLALHRTLLNEHHDFMLASQHPSASAPLRRVAQRYAMPARMWRHGIHSLLELLRHNLPEAREHMITFIYSAYSIIALLYESVHEFRDTFVECLGDLSRYRMAIEDDNQRVRDTWTAVSRRWYMIASDSDPKIGRLYHHIGILARPYIVTQLFNYSKSLCVSIPFAATRESILTLLDPVLEDDVMVNRVPPVDLAFTKVHALLFTRRTDALIAPTTSELTHGLDQHIESAGRSWIEAGAHAAIVNCCALLNYGADDNVLMKVLREHIQRIGTDAIEAEGESKKLVTATAAATEKARPDPQGVDQLKLALRLVTKMDRVVFTRRNTHVYGYVHVRLVWMLSLARLPDAMVYVERDFPWETLVAMLNDMPYYESFEPIEGTEIMEPPVDKEEEKRLELERQQYIRRAQEEQLQQQNAIRLRLLERRQRAAQQEQEAQLQLSSQKSQKNKRKSRTTTKQTPIDTQPSLPVLEPLKMAIPGPPPPRTVENKPLPEDWLLRGLLWTENNYFPANWFDRNDDIDDDKMIETPSMTHVRCKRILWVAHKIALHERWILYDSIKHAFSVAPEFVKGRSGSKDSADIADVEFSDDEQDDGSGEDEDVNIDRDVPMHDLSMDGEVDDDPGLADDTGDDMESISDTNVDLDEIAEMARQQL